MGRVSNATQEIHQSPAGGTIGDAPPPPAPADDDLCEPPADYQPPPPATQPPPPAQPFPPPQEHPNQFTQPQQIHNFPPQQNMMHPQQGIPIVIGPSPLIIMPQQNLLVPQPWNSHLFDCLKNPQNAIITLFFPCVTFGQIAEVLDEGSSSCAMSGIIYLGIAIWIGMPFLMSCGYRSKLRAKFGLIESPAPDFLVHWFCEYCALCQEYRELEKRGFDPTIGHAGNVAKQRLQQFGMTPPMQQRMI